MKGDWAITLHELWDSTWARYVPAGWVPQDPDEQVAVNPNTNPHPHTCWDQSWISRLFERGKERLWLYVDMEDNVFRVGMSIEDMRARPLKRSGVPDMEFDPENEIFWQADRPPFGEDGSLDLTDTIKLCREVAKVISER